MKYVFQLQNGSVIEADTAEEFIIKLCQGDLFTSDMSVEECMKEFAKNSPFNSLKYYTDSPRQFVNKLVQSKIIKWLNKPEK